MPFTLGFVLGSWYFVRGSWFVVHFRPRMKHGSCYFLSGVYPCLFRVQSVANDRIGKAGGQRGQLPEAPNLSSNLSPTESCDRWEARDPHPATVQDRVTKPQVARSPVATPTTEFQRAPRGLFRTPRPSATDTRFFLHHHDYTWLLRQGNDARLPLLASAPADAANMAEQGIRSRRNVCSQFGADGVAMMGAIYFQVEKEFPMTAARSQLVDVHVNAP